MGDGDEKKSDTIELFLGRRVHECLEVLYAEAHKGSIWSLSFVLGLFDIRWQENWNNNNITIVRNKFPALHYKELGIKCLTDYYNRFYPFTQNKLLGIEQRINIKIADNNEFQMVGVVDRIDEHQPVGRYEQGGDGQRRQGLRP